MPNALLFYCLTSLGGPDLVLSPDNVITEMSSGMALDEKLNTCRGHNPNLRTGSLLYPMLPIPYGSVPAK